MEIHPANMPVPQEKRTSQLWLRPLRAIDAELDYEAVMSSAEMLHRWSQSEWPTANFTLEENLADLKWHEHKHHEREAFTYTVLNPQGTSCLGCVYITPIRSEQIPLCKAAACAADVGFWVRETELINNLDKHLLSTILEWFRTEWVFDRVLFTIGQKEVRQAALFEAAGLEQLLACTLSDQSPCRVFG